MLLAEHSDDGAMGLVLNRPTDTPVADALPDLAGLAGEGQTVYLGGPVALESVLAVAELDDPADASELLFGAVGFVQEPDVAVQRGRVFVGYAGWTAGQLEAELEEELARRSRRAGRPVRRRAGRALERGAPPPGWRVRGARADAARPVAELTLSRSR